MRLSELRTGDKGVIVKVMGRGAFRKRIIEMGFIRGKEVEVIQSAPLKDPIHYRVMGYDVSLRRQDAELIEVVSAAEFASESIKNPLQARDTINNIETTNLNNLSLFILFIIHLPFSHLLLYIIIITYKYQNIILIMCENVKKLSISIYTLYPILQI